MGVRPRHGGAAHPRRRGGGLARLSHPVHGAARSAPAAGRGAGAAVRAARHDPGGSAGAVHHRTVRLAAGEGPSQRGFRAPCERHDRSPRHGARGSGTSARGSPAGTRASRGGSSARSGSRHDEGPPAAQAAPRALRPRGPAGRAAAHARLEVPDPLPRRDQSERCRRGRAGSADRSGAEAGRPGHHPGAARHLEVAMTDPRRRLPAVEALLAEPDVAALLAAHPRSLVLRAVRETIDVARANGGTAPPEGWGRAVLAKVRRLAAPSFGPVINAAGVVLHTNLGRAPLARPAIEAMARIAGAYSNLEYDLARGARGSRHGLCRGLLTELTGAEDALVVNNAASALLLALSGLARDGDALASGVDAVVFSGDKLLGGPQAGILLGTKPAIDACRTDPLARAVRSDKFTLAALEATLALYRDPEIARREIPVLRMLTEDVTQIRRRAEALHKGVGKGSDVIEGESEVGGGSFPGKTLKTWLVQLTSDHLTSEVLAARLRATDPPVIARIADDHVVL